jgi:hypothetical protein
MEEDISSEKKEVSFFTGSYSVLILRGIKAVVGPRINTAYDTENSLNAIAGLLY